MLRDRNCDKNFERSLMYQINKAKIGCSQDAQRTYDRLQ